MRNIFSRTPSIPPNSIPLIRTDLKDKIPPGDFFLPQNKQALRNFVFYNIGAFSVENVIAYAAMLVFKASPSFDKAMYIYTHFVASSAAMEVNLAAHSVSAVKLALGITGPAPAHAGLLAPTVFDSAMGDLRANMMDTLDRHLPLKQIGNVAYYPRVNPTAAVVETQLAIRGLCGAGFMMPQTLVSI